MTGEERFDRYVFSFIMNEKNEPEFFSYVGDIYETPQFKSMDRYIQHADITRMRHIMSVSYLSYLEARERGLDFVAAARGAMLHDLFFYDWHKRGDGTHRLHGYRHPSFALKNAQSLFVLSGKEKNIILRHMWPLTPIPPDSYEGLVVSLCDKYCAANEIMILRSASFRKKFEEKKEELKKSGGERE